MGRVQTPPSQAHGLQSFLATSDFSGSTKSEAARVIPRSPASSVLPEVEDLAENLLVISPYCEHPHLLDLNTVALQPRLLAKALTVLHPVRPDYATAAYVETFNWEEVIAKLQALVKSAGHAWKGERFFIVSFRSTVPPTTDNAHLGDLDKAAHAEAMRSGGFLKYWFGVPDRSGKNLATCLWTSPEAARLGGVGPAHRRAAGAARSSYTHWYIERLGLNITDGVKDWTISPWTPSV